MYIANSRSYASLRSRHHQRGTAAIEFGLLFMIFFAVFYALVSYALPMTMLQAFHHAAAAGARAAVAAANCSNDPCVDNGVVTQVRDTVGSLLDWLPEQANMAVLGEDNGNVQVDFNAGTGIVKVTVDYPNYRSNPLIPILDLPGFGEVPRLPQDLVGEASLQL